MPTTIRAANLMREVQIRLTSLLSQKTNAQYVVILVCEDGWKPLDMMDEKV